MEKTTKLEDLPDFILQHIQALLPIKDASCTSIVSKSLFRAWSTRPSRRFRFFFDASNSHLQESFVEWVTKTLVRYRQHDLAVEKLSLSTNVQGPKQVFLLNESLKLASSIGLKELSLSVDNEYVLPFEILFSKTLKKIEMTGGCLEKPCHILKSHSLVSLELYNVYVDKETTDALLSSFPFVQKITLQHPHCFENIRVANLHHLEELKIISGLNKSVEIQETPRLQFFVYDRSLQKCRVLNQIIRHVQSFKIDTTASLKRLTLQCSSITDFSFHELISKFPNLEQLVLNDCRSLTSINIRSDSLKKMSIRRCEKLNNVHVHAPDLNTIYYSGKDASTVFSGIPHTQLHDLLRQDGEKKRVSFEEVSSSLENFFK